MIRFRHSSLPVLLGMAALAPTPATAAQSYDGCTGFIDSVPATITTQGVWCLRKDLATSISSGAAITIATNNVTIDCNDFKLGGLAAGNGSLAKGIALDSRQNATVRNCNIRGFHFGLSLENGAGHLVEDNRLDNNLFVGISVHGANSMIRRNRVYDTGGPGSSSYGIRGNLADVIDNTVSGLFSLAPVFNATGIYMNQGNNNLIRGNRVSGLMPSTASVIGIVVGGNTYVRIADNHVATTPAISGIGILAQLSPRTSCRGNTVGGFSVAIQDCTDAGGNEVL